MIVVDKKKYKMAIEQNMKEVHVRVNGLIREEDAEAYMIDLQETISTVPKQQYTFVIDAVYQTPTPSKVVPQMEGAMLFYASLGFKDIIVVKPASKIAQVQIRNVLERIEFPGTFVDSLKRTSVF